MRKSARRILSNPLKNLLPAHCFKENRMKLGVIAVVSTLVIASCSPTQAQKSKIDMGEFSATVNRTAADKCFAGKMFISKDKIRDETVNEGRKSVTIIRLDKGLCWVIMDNNRYMEINSLDQKDLVPIEKQTEQKYRIKSLGKETVSGYSCEVKQYSCKGEDCGVTTQWYSPKLNYMVKTEHTKNGKLTFKQELTDIKEGKPSASLFEVPAGYTKFDPYSQMPAEMQNMMKGMMKGMTKGGMPKNRGSEGAGDK
jgi:hypothetical protein